MHCTTAKLPLKVSKVSFIRHVYRPQRRRKSHMFTAGGFTHKYSRPCHGRWWLESLFPVQNNPGSILDFDSSELFILKLKQCQVGQNGQSVINRASKNVKDFASGKIELGVQRTQTYTELNHNMSNVPAQNVQVQTMP